MQSEFTSSDPAFDFKNFMGFTFEGGDPIYPYKSCAVVLFQLAIRLHALDILNRGAEKLGGPIQIGARYPGSGLPNDGAGHVLFVAAPQNQRAALTLVNGVIYVAFASHEDRPPFHGWVLAYSAANLQQIATYNTTPNSLEGGIWMSGQGLVADSNNNLCLITGNGLQFYRS